jgi:hypothetical protein
MYWNVTDATANPFLYGGDPTTGWRVGYTYTCTSESYCDNFARSTARLIPGIVALIILIAGGITFAVGWEKNNIKTMLASFIIMIIGIVIVGPISEIVISTC